MIVAKNRAFSCLPEMGFSSPSVHPLVGTYLRGTQKYHMRVMVLGGGKLPGLEVVGLRLL